MSATTRRAFVRQCMAAALGTPALGALAQAGDASETRPQLGRLLGKIAPRPAAAIAASPLSVGFETLDRRLFEPERTYDALAQLGVKWARVQTGWARTEPEKGRYDFAWLDEIVDRMLKIGVQPWFNVGYGNRLYTPEASEQVAVGWAPLNSDEAKQGWARFVARLAEHFRGRVRHWEIWNEPNITGFWKPNKPSADDYVQLAKLTGPAIRTHIPDSVLIGGGLSGMPTDYLKRCLEVGLAECVDKVSYHPYRLVPESGDSYGKTSSYDATVSMWRQLLRQYKPSLGLWQGECGCPSRNDGIGALSSYSWTETRQAKWLLRRMLCDLRLKIELTSYFHLADLGNYSWGESGKKKPTKRGAFFGLLRDPDYSLKPSYHAFQAVCTLFDAGTQQTDLPLDVQLAANDKEPLAAEKICTASFARGDAPLYAWWYPTDVQKDFPPRQVRVSVRPGSQLRLTSPVLVDPLACAVYQATARKSGAALEFGPVPLADYPLLLTDASAVPTKPV